MRQKVDFLCEGNIVNEDIVNDAGVLLINRGAVLGLDTIEFLKDQHISYVEIEKRYTLLSDEQMEEAILQAPMEYSISAEEIDSVIDDKCSFKEEYICGIDAIRHIDVDTTMEVAKGLCDKISSSENLQEELALLRKGCDSILTHSMNVAVMTASIIVWKENMTDRDYYETVAGAMLHDIGKLYVPRAILEKPGRLNEEEYAIVKQHASLGYMKLKSLGNVSEKIARMAYEHHENVDGSGYPLHLKDDEILNESKIIHIADVYEAMTAKRCYKQPMLPGDVTEYTMSKNGMMFNQNCLKDFLRTVPAYNKGDMVMLSNRNLAEVLSCNQLNSLRPKIRMISTGEEIDLFREKNKLNITIVDMA